MTEQVSIKAEELKQEILASEEYRNYDKYKRLLNQDPELSKELNEFRTANLKLQLTPYDENKDAKQQLADKYSDLLDNSVAREFLSSELLLCKMIQQIDEILLSELDFQLDFL